MISNGNLAKKFLLLFHRAVTRLGIIKRFVIFVGSGRVSSHWGFVSLGRPHSASKFQEELELEAWVINLSSRPDRIEGFTSSASGLFEEIRRFDAIEEDIGQLGCAKSHSVILEQSISRSLPCVAIFEDDFRLKVSAEEVRGIVNEFLSLSFLDVLCIAHQTWGPSLRVSENLRVGFGVQTTAGYVVKARAMSQLLEVFRESIELIEAGAPPELNAIDVAWQSLQGKKALFCIPSREIANQAGGYSDIDRKWKPSSSR